MPLRESDRNFQCLIIIFVGSLTHTFGNDLVQTGQRRWGVGDRSHVADYMPFYFNQPAHVNIEHCYTMYKHTDWLMHDYHCHVAFNFHICEL